MVQLSLEKGTIMYKRAVALLLLFVLVFSPLFAEAELTYAPYGEKEFPIWTMKLRRAESLFFGSLVITLPLSMLTWSLLKNYGVINTSGMESVNEFLYQAGIASVLSLGISTADYIIGEVQGD